MLFVLAVSLAGAGVAAEGPETMRFDVERFEVEGGGESLSARRTGRILRRFVGPGRTLEDLQRAAAELETEYRQRGYVTTQVFLPEQTLDGGVVRLQVAQSTVGKVTPTGNRHFSEANLRRSIPALREGEVPNVLAISDQTQIANQSPAKQVRVVLKPTDTPGTVDANLEMVREERPWRIFASLDNTGTKQTGRERFGIGFQHANLFDRDHIATFQYITSVEKPDQVAIYTLGYRAPVYGWGDSIDVYAGYSDVDSGQSTTPAGPLAISGRGQIYGARYNLTLPRIAEYEHRLVGGIDYRLYDSACSLGTFGAGGCVSVGISPGKVAVRPLSLGYAGAWSPAGRRFDLYLTASGNLPGGAHGEEADFRAIQANAPADFTMLRYGASLATLAGGDWQVRLAVNGQQSRDALISGERFGVGGFNSVRGFLERELQADRAVAATVELYSPDLGARWSGGAASARALVFYDHGAGSLNAPLPGQARSFSVSSAGIGVRLSWKRNLSLRADAASVVDAGGQQGRGDVLVHFGLLATF